MFKHDLCLSIIPGSNSRVMICFHGYGGNGNIIKELKDSGLIDSTLVGFNFPDHDIPQKPYDPEQLTFGTIAELLPALYVLKKHVIDDKIQSIDLYGRSAGGGVLINLIAVLNTERFSNELQQLGIGIVEKKQLLTVIQNGMIILDVPLKSVEEIIDFRGSTDELEILAKNYRDNHLRPIDTIESLYGLSLNIIVHFQESDEVISNRDDQMFIDKLSQTNSLGKTFVILAREAGHTGLHQSLWKFYSEKLSKKD